MGVKPTKDELLNGWTEISLTKYHKEREKAQAQNIIKVKSVKPMMQATYRPLRWRD